MNHLLKKSFVGVTISLFSLWPALSFADWNGHDSHSHDSSHTDSGHHDNGRHDGGHRHSSINLDFSVQPYDYYYNAPYYPTYYSPSDDVLLSAPIEPVDQEPAIIQPPAVVINPIGPMDQENSSPDTFTVNIPNNKGGYTAVVIKKSGNGYTGPQGEFYTDFPKVSQLKVMYGK